MNRFLNRILAGLCLSGSLLLASCSSSPSEEEMKALSDLKAEVSALESKVATMQRDKAGLEKQIADKNAKLQQCQSDQEAVKKGLGK